MDNLQLAGRYLGRVFNSKSGCMCPKHLFCYEAKQPNLKLKTRPKLLGTLPSFRAPPVWLFTSRNATELVALESAFFPHFFSPKHAKHTL
jgi:hypothetical protein